MGAAALKEIDPVTAQAWLEAGKAVLIDVRGAGEYGREHIADSRLVPLPTLRQTDFAPLHNDHSIAVFTCATGTRTRMAARQLAATGFTEVYNLTGGLQAWKRAGLPVKRDPAADRSCEAPPLVPIGIVLAVAAVMVVATLQSPGQYLNHIAIGAVVFGALMLSPCVGGRLLGWVLGRRRQRS